MTLLCLEDLPTLGLVDGLDIEEAVEQRSSGSRAALRASASVFSRSMRRWV